MRKAFTMIELIFVIVVLGILAAVALPKFAGMSEQAHVSNLTSFTSTLNGTLGPTWWSKAMTEGADGNISKLGIDSKAKLEEYTDVPKEIDAVNLNYCDDPDKNKTVMTVDENKIGNGKSDFVISCMTGTATKAPKFALWKLNSANDKGLGDEINSSVATLISPK